MKKYPYEEIELHGKKTFNRIVEIGANKYRKASKKARHELHEQEKREKKHLKNETVISFAKEIKELWKSYFR